MEGGCIVVVKMVHVSALQMYELFCCGVLQ